MPAARARSGPRPPRASLVPALLAAAGLGLGPPASPPDRSEARRRLLGAAALAYAYQAHGADVSPAVGRLVAGWRDYARTNEPAALERAIEEAERALERALPPGTESAARARLERQVGETRVRLLGQVHIDLAFRWPWTETVAIAQSTFRNQVRALARDGSYAFYQNQAALYRAVEEADPALFQMVQRLVREGRWHVVGGQWSETSQELCSSESLARNYLYGQRYFEEKFGRVARVGWQVEGSGYLGTFPQLMAQAGLEAALLGRQDRWWGPWRPLLRWRGVDGTELPVAAIRDYEFAWRGPARPVIRDALLGAHPHRPQELLLPFGGGDHGGGASPERLPELRKLLAAEGLPEPVPVADTDALLHSLQSPAGGSLPLVEGHLQISPYDSNTGLVTQSEVKRGVRTSENLLYEADLWAAVAPRVDPEIGGRSLPEAWKQLLLNQFHDVIWGTTAFEAYHEALTRFDQIRRTARGTIETVLGDVLLPRIDTRGEGIPVVVFNALPWPRSDAVELDVDERLASWLEGRSVVVAAPDGAETPGQMTSDRKLLFVADGVPAGGYRVFWVRDGAAGPSAVRAEAGAQVVLGNAQVRVGVDPSDGGVASVHWKPLDRELVPRGTKANALELYLDAGDAWRSDLRERIPARGAGRRASLVETGPVRARWRLVTEWRRGRALQTVSVTALAPRVDFEIRGDWTEERAQLLAAFPVDAEGRLFTEIPFGHLDWERHRRRLAEWFGPPLEELRDAVSSGGRELPQNRWAAVEGRGVTVALLNDSKPAIRFRPGVLALPIVRTPPFVERGTDVLHPDPKPGEPGHGSPRFNDTGPFGARYALVAGAGTWPRLELERRGAEFNVPLRGKIAPTRRGQLPPEGSFVELGPGNLVLTSFKGAEDGSGDAVARIFEAHGEATEGSLRVRGLAEAWEATLLERPVARVADGAGPVFLRFRPHQIRTLRLRFSPRPGPDARAGPAGPSR